MPDEIRSCGADDEEEASHQPEKSKEHKEGFQRKDQGLQALHDERAVVDVDRHAGGNQVADRQRGRAKA